MVILASSRHRAEHYGLNDLFFFVPGKVDLNYQIDTKGKVILGTSKALCKMVFMGWRASQSLFRSLLSCETIR